MISKLTEAIRRYLKRILGGKAFPFLSIIALVLFGGVLYIGIHNNAPNASIVILIFTVLGILFIVYFAYLSQQKAAMRLSNEIEISKPLYRTLNTQLTWIIEDHDGKSARLQKKKSLRAMETIRIIPEYYWGDGAPPNSNDFYASMNNNKLFIKRIQNQGSRYETEIDLGKEFVRGDEFTFEYSRIIRDAFLKNREWVEMTVDSRTDNAEMAVIFPLSRPFKYARVIRRLGAYSYAASLGDEGFTEIMLETGQKQLYWKISTPPQGWVFTIEWEW